MSLSRLHTSKKAAAASRGGHEAATTSCQPSAPVSGLASCHYHQLSPKPTVVATDTAAATTPALIPPLVAAKAGSLQHPSAKGLSFDA